MPQALIPGTILQGVAHRYEIVRTLGQGAFGITYLATTRMEGSLGAIDIKVAVKEFFMKDINSREGSSVTGGTSHDGLFDRYRQKFRREAQNLSSMQHPGIVRVIEAFDANDTSYIVMEFLAGGSINDLVYRRGPLPEEEALRFARAIGDALSYMHAHHMLHLDLKPSNVMLDEKGDPVIIDFGLAKHYGDDGNPESSTSVGAGTPGYAPLEQSSYHEGRGFPVTLDVYALGATLFKMLTGRRPPEADEVMNDGFPYDDFKDVSRHTIDVVAKAMSFRKADRYPTVADFLAALDNPQAPDESTNIIPTGHTIERHQAGLDGRAPEAEGVANETTVLKKPAAPPKKKKKRVWLVILLIVSAVTLFILLAIVPAVKKIKSGISRFPFGRGKDWPTEVTSDKPVDTHKNKTIKSTTFPTKEKKTPAKNAKEREQAIHEAADAICNCSSGDDSKIESCIHAVISSAFAAYQNDDEFVTAVEKEVIKCVAKKAARKAIDKATDKFADEAAKQLQSLF